ncbi:hypothetical protein Taro_051285, partial [Colocasia esculenta]|nr:hypothetical protein [Colocasia esculenta]
LKFIAAMASRGRRGGAPAREDEPRREERAEQQAPAPQGPVLPPPPPVDYGVFMQGLVQAMQTQAHTQAALQAQLEAQQAQVPAQDYGGPSIMERFKRMLPPSFKGKSDPLLAESRMREIEKIFRAIRCADEDKVTLATYMLQEGEMEQYLEEKKVSQKRPAASFQRQDKKKAVYQTQQRSVAVGNAQRPQDQGLPKTSAGSSAWSASPSSGSGSSVSYRKTRKASSPSSSCEGVPGILLQQGGSWNIEEEFPDLGLLRRLIKNPEEDVSGDFLGLPKESFYEP